MRPFSIFVALLLSLPAIAEDEKKSSTEDRTVIYKQRTEIDFEGLEIEGQLVKPSGALVLDRKAGSFNPLIKLRTDFNEEMAKSVDEIK